MLDARRSHTGGPALRRIRTLALIALLGVVGPGAAGAGRGPAPAPSVDLADPGRSVAMAFSENALAVRFATLSPSLRALADPADRTGAGDGFALTPGWEILDLSRPPSLDLARPDPELDADEARRINALRPISREPMERMPPFQLAGPSEDRVRAHACLTQAVYYEAAREPDLGQSAVAQVVLNRLRHPGYPKSVCGVVYQGSARPTGCQFTFTCDGSLARPPEPGLWARAGEVARRALAGHVVRGVGSATHYHADYVAPYWAPTLVKLAQIGTHIFYRWTGPSGEAPAFTGRYAGGEDRLAPEILGGVDPRTQAGLEVLPLPPPRTITLTLAGEARTYTVAEAEGAGPPGLPAPGQLSPARRRPTPEEIRRINDSLAALERGDATSAQKTPSAPSGSVQP